VTSGWSTGAAVLTASLEPTQHERPVAEIAEFFSDILELLPVFAPLAVEPFDALASAMRVATGQRRVSEFVARDPQLAGIRQSKAGRRSRVHFSRRLATAKLQLAGAAAATMTPRGAAAIMLKRHRAGLAVAAAPTGEIGNTGCHVEYFSPGCLQCPRPH
jgi:hypothetical protein